MKTEFKLLQTRMLCGFAWLTLGLSLVPATADTTFTDADWSSMNPSIPGADTVVSAAVMDGAGNLYIGGSVTVVGGVLANRIAKWDGSRWKALGLGIEGVAFGGVPSVTALAVSGSNLYAGGTFVSAGGIEANGIAKWDGSAWTAFGSGMNAEVFALARFGSDLYAGGSFTSAGGKVSAYIARAYLPTLPTLSILRSGTDVMAFWPSATADDFSLEQSATLAPSSWITNAAPVTDDGTNKSVTLPDTNSAQFVRLRRP